MGMGTLLGHNGGGFILFSFQIAVPTPDFATYGEIYGTGCLTAWAAGVMGLVSTKKEKIKETRRRDSGTLH